MTSREQITSQIKMLQVDVAAVVGWQDAVVSINTER